MFLVNSRHHHFSAALPGSGCSPFTRECTPSSEGTGLFCRVPWPEFSRAPRIIHPAHLCRFAVRFTRPIFRSFSWQLGISSLWPCGLGIASRHTNTGICLRILPTCLHLVFQHQDCLSSCVPPSREHASTRILTRFPSATLFSLALGAD